MTTIKTKEAARWLLWLVWGLALATLLVAGWNSQQLTAAGVALPGRLGLALVLSGALFSFFSVYLFTTRND